MPDIPMPDVSDGAKDETALAKADLGIVGRVRLQLGALVILVGLRLIPAGLRETFDEMEVQANDEAE